MSEGFSTRARTRRASSSTSTGLGTYTSKPAWRMEASSSLPTRPVTAISGSRCPSCSRARRARAGSESPEPPGAFPDHCRRCRSVLRVRRSEGRPRPPRPGARRATAAADRGDGPRRQRARGLHSPGRLRHIRSETGRRRAARPVASALWSRSLQTIPDCHELDRLGAKARSRDGHRERRGGDCTLKAPKGRQLFSPGRSWGSAASTSSLEP